MKRCLPGLALVLCLAFLIFGCGGGALPQNHSATTTTTTTGSGTTGGTAGVTVNAANGGLVSSASGTVVLNIPAKALSANTKISINPATTTSLPTLPANTQIVSGTAFELAPDGQYFNSSPTLRIAYATANIPSGISERDLKIYSVVNGAWQPLLNCVDDPTNHILTVSITHFSVYAVVSVLNYSGTPAYDLIDLGVLSGDTSSQPEALSSNGLAVGISSSAAGVHAFIWNQGLMTNLGTRSGDIGAKAFCVDASDIAGGTSIQNPLYSYPVLFEGGAATEVDTASGAGTGAVTAINDAGDYIVGNAIVIQDALTSFSNFGPAASACALNSSGTVAGYSGSQAAYWSNGSVTQVGLLTGYDTSVGTAISDANVLVGTAFNAATNKPIGFMYSGGTMSAINPISGDDILIPASANDGAVVGESTADFNSVRGFIYSGGVIADLNTLIPSGTGWSIANAISINNSGLILCSGSNSSGASHAILLVPRPATVPALARRSSRTVIRRR